MDELCQSPLKARQYLSGPTIFWLVIDKVGVIGGNFFDIPAFLPFPCNTFFLAAIKGGDEANSLFFSFVPTNYPRGFSFASLKGTDQIFQMVGSQDIATSPHYYTIWKFKEAVQTLYFHMGSENGELSRYSIGCVVGTDFNVRGGIYF